MEMILNKDKRELRPEEKLEIEKKKESKMCLIF